MLNSLINKTSLGWHIDFTVNKETGKDFTVGYIREQGKTFLLIILILLVNTVQKKTQQQRLSADMLY